MQNILIIPSWYPTPDDKINGSFFQEQARLVSDRFDVKVLFIRFNARPSIRSFLKTPISTCIAFLKFILKPRKRNQFPADEIFLNPELIEYSVSAFGITRHGLFKKRLDCYLAALDELIATGWRPDLVHAHSVNLGGLVARRIKEVYGIPYVITEHVPFALNNYPAYMQDDIKSAFEEADIVLSLGYDKVRQLGISGIHVEPNLIYNFVDEDEFNKVCRPYRPGSPLKLISIGAASHLKDQRTLLRALKVLKEKNIPFKLTLVGMKTWGDLYYETLDCITQYGLASEVTVVDQIERGNVPDYLSANQIYLMTSVAEGLPVSVLEAMACGLFVVATRHGGTEDILNAESGVLVEVKNHQKIADRLEDIYRGDIRFEPQIIREHVVSLCGKDAFGSRLSGYYMQAMRQIT